MAYSAATVVETPTWVAEDLGLFQKYGVDVQLQQVSGGSRVMQTLVGGQIDMGTASEDAVIAADLKGADVAIVASGIDKLLISIYGSSKLNSIADLKGKKLGIIKFGGSGDFAARYVLAKNHLQPGKDVAILQIGGVPEILAALKSGAIAAGTLGPPLTFKAKQEGFHELADLANYDLSFYLGPLNARKAWLKDHHDEALKVIKGYAAAVATIHKDKQTTMKIIGKYTKTSDPVILEASYEALLKVLPKVPLPKPDAIEFDLQQQQSPADQKADPQRFIDPSLVQELQKSGFIDALYR